MWALILTLTINGQQYDYAIDHFKTVGQCYETMWAAQRKDQFMSLRLKGVYAYTSIACERQTDH